MWFPVLCGPLRRDLFVLTEPPAHAPNHVWGWCFRDESGVRSDAAPLLLSPICPPLHGLGILWLPTLSKNSSSVDTLCSMSWMTQHRSDARQARAGTWDPAAEELRHGLWHHYKTPCYVLTLRSMFLPWVFTESGVSTTPQTVVGRQLHGPETVQGQEGKHLT